MAALPNILESGHQPILYENIAGGVSRAQPPHQIEQSKWYDALNMRFRGGEVTQVDPLVVNSTLDSGATDTGTVQVITPVNINATSSSLVALTPKYLYTLDANSYVATQQNPVAYTTGRSWDRWAWMVNSTGLYFTNLDNQVKKFVVGGGDPTNVAVTGTAYKAAYIEDFYGHLVLGNVKDGSTTYANRLVWSDVNDYSEWTPSSTNEADLYDIEQTYGASPNGIGITGLKKLGDQLFIYTANSIWGMRYVGLQAGVMQITSRVRDVGNYFPYALVSVRDAHFFIGQDNFYAFDGNSAVAIGADIKDYFFEDLHPLLEYQNLTHVAVDPDNQEITWYYCSKNSNGVIDKAIVYNYEERLFYPIDGCGITAVMRSRVQTYTPIDALTGTIDGLTGTIDELSAGNAFAVNLYGSSGTQLLRDANELDSPDDYITQSEPYLETGDIHHGTVQGYKEVSSLTVDAGYTTGEGVKVQFSTRDRLSADPTWQTAGLWTPSVQEKRLSLPRANGRVMRYRFSATASPSWLIGDNPGFALMLVLDQSMDFDTSTGNTFALDNAISLIQMHRNLSGEKRLVAVGYVAFGNTSQVLQPLTTDIESVLQKLNRAKTIHTDNAGFCYGGLDEFWFDNATSSTNGLEALTAAYDELRDDPIADSLGHVHVQLLSPYDGFSAASFDHYDTAVHGIQNSPADATWVWTNGDLRDMAGSYADLPGDKLRLNLINLTTFLNETVYNKPTGFKFKAFEENVYRLVQER